MKNLEHFKNKLLTLRAEVIERLTKVDADIRHEGMTADMDDQAIELENDEVLNVLNQSLNENLTMIDGALARIDAGEYFNCRTCSKDIPQARLESLPYISQCISCAERLEQ